ncbi:hypothetical protein [Leisingera caerulea]|uniref:hypothetical protein n=1 Tax=Leisingera caerulea TaxID=506591 RepID=UPI0004893F74|nr:hypothetical protein [Leisingera caerulea]
MNIRCVTVGKHITAQGELVQELANGEAIVLSGQRQVTGKLVPALNSNMPDIIRSAEAPAP